MTAVRWGPVAIAHALAWMTERSFYLAASRSEGELDLEQVTKTTIEIWLGTIKGGSRRTAGRGAADNLPDRSRG